MRPCVRSPRSTATSGWPGRSASTRSRLMASVGLDVADLAAPDKWIPAAAVARLLELSAERSGLEDFGLRLAGLRRLSTLGPLSVVLRQEPDLRSALDLLIRYEHSYNEALRLRLDEASDLATMRLWFEFGEPAPTRQALELATAALLGHRPRAARAGSGSRCRSASPTSAPAVARRPPRALRAAAAVRARVHRAGLLRRPSSTPPTRRPTRCCGPTPQQFLQALRAPRAATVTGQVRELVELLLPARPVLDAARSPGAWA